MGEFIPESVPELMDFTSIKPVFTPSSAPEPPRAQSIIKTLSLLKHPEGGYFNQTDVNDYTITSPYPREPLSEASVASAPVRPDYDPALRRLSTLIFYYLSPRRPKGHFHVNRSRIIHTLQKGRGRYVLVHPDGRVESFVVGHDIEKGERLQWVVEGGVWKGSFLLETEGESEGLLISEVVTPGFEFADHSFMSQDQLRELLPEDQAKELEWLIHER